MRDVIIMPVMCAQLGPPRVCQVKQCNQRAVIDKTLIIVANYAITDKIIAHAYQLQAQRD